MPEAVTVTSSAHSGSGGSKCQATGRHGKKRPAAFWKKHKESRKGKLSRRATGLPDDPTLDRGVFDPASPGRFRSIRDGRRIFIYVSKQAGERRRSLEQQDLHQRSTEARSPVLSELDCQWPRVKNLETRVRESCLREWKIRSECPRHHPAPHQEEREVPGQEG
jgi:hypothetical protein